MTISCGVRRLLGIQVNGDDARHLAATLIVRGTPDALTAGAQPTKASSVACTPSGSDKSRSAL